MCHGILRRAQSPKIGEISRAFTSTFSLYTHDRGINTDKQTTNVYFMSVRIPVFLYY